MAESRDSLSGPASGEIVLYSAPGGDVRVECLLREETIWLTQKAIAELFGVEVPAVSKHIANIYETQELRPEATLSKMETVRQEGGRQVRRNLDYFNLDAIIAVGYRVSSYQATQFRIWATKTLKEFMIKGFVLDDDRLKQGKVLKSDVSVAKNYLNQTHMRELDRIVSAYLDLAENRAERGILMKMKDWAGFLDSFLQLSDYPILEDKGKVSALEAKLKAEGEFEQFRVRQDREFVSDFDREVKRLKGEK